VVLVFVNKLKNYECKKDLRSQIRQCGTEKIDLAGFGK